MTDEHKNKNLLLILKCARVIKLKSILFTCNPRKQSDSHIVAINHLFPLCKTQWSHNFKLAAILSLAAILQLSVYASFGNKFILRQNCCNILNLLKGDKRPCFVSCSRTQHSDANEARTHA